MQSAQFAIHRMFPKSSAFLLGEQITDARARMGTWGLGIMCAGKFHTEILHRRGKNGPRHS